LLVEPVYKNSKEEHQGRGKEAEGHWEGGSGEIVRSRRKIKKVRRGGRRHGVGGRVEK
jgi:hypothetical protein